MQSYKRIALRRLRSAIPATPPCPATQRNTSEATYQENVAGVLSMDPAASILR